MKLTYEDKILPKTGAASLGQKDLRDTTKGGEC